MNDAATFVRDCIASGAVFTSLCALLSVPFLVTIAARLIAPAVASMTEDPLWQAPLAAITAALPGSVFLSIAIFGLVAGWGSTCMEFITGRVLYAAIALITMVALARASIAVSREVSQVRGLIAASHPASSRLARLACEAGVPARELHIEAPLFALAGLVKPVVLVSRDTLFRLSDAQIAAALQHEAAHRRRQDVPLALLLVFVSRLFPLSAAGITAIYHSAREAAADKIALRAVKRLDLAGAIAVMARARYTAAPALSGSGDLHTRMQLLAGERAYDCNTRARTVALGALMLTATLGFSPLWLAALHLFACNGARPQ